MSGPVLAIDQSGARCRAVLFSPDRRVLATAREDLKPLNPRSGQVEFDPEEIWTATIATCRAALVRARIDPGAVSAIGIAADADTTVAWDRDTGKPVCNAIAGADNRTDGRCHALREAGVESLIRARTGLRIDPGGAGPRLAWILDNVVSARSKAESGELAFGGVGCFLLWRLTEGRVHATDATSAASSLLFGSEAQSWDSQLLDVFSIPSEALPEVFENATYFGAVDAALFGGSGPVGVHGMAPPAQAAHMGQGGLRPDAISLSFAGGCSALRTVSGPRAGTDDQIIAAARLNGRIGYARIAANAAASDAFEWARGAFGLTEGFEQTDRLVRGSDLDAELYFVPPRLPVGAPWNDGPVAGLVHGIGPGTLMADLLRSTLESAAFAASDLIEAIADEDDDSDDLPPVRVSGGVAASNWAMQFLADILDRPVERPLVPDTSALGVAWLAGYHAGDWPNAQTFAAELATDRRFEPQMSQGRRKARLAGWHRAVRLAIAAEAAR